MPKERPPVIPTLRVDDITLYVAPVLPGEVAITLPATVRFNHTGEWTLVFEAGHFTPAQKARAVLRCPIRVGPLEGNQIRDVEGWSVL